MDNTNTFEPSTIEKQNGQVATFQDNRLHLVVDGRFVETWELMVMESMKISDWLMVFSRYLCKGDRLISSNLPNKPLDELSKAELSQIRNSDAYKALQRMKMPSLKEAAESFAKQAASFGEDEKN